MNKEKVYSTLIRVIHALDCQIAELSFETIDELEQPEFNEVLEARSLIKKAERILSNIKDGI